MNTLKQPQDRSRQAFMLKAANILGTEALELISQRGIEMELKPDGTKVTTADITLNQRFMDMVKKFFPADLVWGEEGSSSEKGDLEAADKQWLWLIDPIDGTSGFWRSYQNGNFTDNTSSIMITGFAPGTSVPTVSVVHNPFHRLPTTIEADCTGARLHTSRADAPLSIALSSLQKARRQVDRFEENYWEHARPDLRRSAELYPYAEKIRTSSVGLAMARVALGHIDITAFPAPSNPHDIAPGALLAHQAGAFVGDLAGNRYDQIDWRVGPIEGCVAAANEALAGELITASQDWY